MALDQRGPCRLVGRSAEKVVGTQIKLVRILPVTRTYNTEPDIGTRVTAQPVGPACPSHPSAARVQCLKRAHLRWVLAQRVRRSPRQSKRWQHGADKPSKHCARITKTESNS